MGMPALAREAYGDRRTLSKTQRRQRSRSWWRMGGPMRLLLWRPLRFDQRVLRWWRNSTHLQVLDSLSWPQGFDPGDMRSRLDSTLLRWILLDERWRSILLWVGGAAQAVGVVVTWPVIFWTARHAGGVATQWATVAAVVGTVLAFTMLRLVFFRIARADSWYGLLVRAVPIGLILLASGYALSRATWLMGVWPNLAGIVLVATAGMAMWYFLAVAPGVVWRGFEISRHWRHNPREDILDELLNIINDLGNPLLRNDLAQRGIWCLRLESAASTMEKRLPASFGQTDQTTVSWLTERARGAARALRQMKRQLLAPVDGTWDRLAATLRKEVVALASGDLGDLRWAAPPSNTAVRKPRWRIALGMLRAIASAVVPLVVLLAVQPLLHLDAGVLQWAKLIGLAWALLYLLVTADPTLREKVELAQSISSFSTTRREPGRTQHWGPPDQGSG